MFDKIICDTYENIDKLGIENSVDLSIVYPPHWIKNYANFLKTILPQIEKVTKLKGVCCIIVEDQLLPESDTMSMNATKAILEVLDSKKSKTGWLLNDRIIWVKSSKENNQNFEQMDTGLAINFEKTPFATIYVLTQKKYELERMGFRERIESLPISKAEKDEVSDNMWFIHPFSEKGYKDRIPKELASRLIMLFSNEGDLILDVFSGNGVTGIIAKNLKRYYLCLEQNKTDFEIMKKRLSDDSHK